MRRDIEFFITKLGDLQGFGTTGEHLMGIVDTKTAKAPMDDASQAAKEDENTAKEDKPEVGEGDAKDSGHESQSSPSPGEATKSN